jgi:L-aspartate oxidase
MQTFDSDFLVIGSGIAGLMSAHYLSEHGSVILVTKRAADVSNTNWAQGGISCVMDETDSLDAHVADTLSAGGGLCREDVVRAILAGGAEGIRDMETLGVRFARLPENPASYDLGREGGHTHRRVLHAGDITGNEIVRGLLNSIRANKRVRIIEDAMAIDLVNTGWLGLPGASRCIGAYFLGRSDGAIFAVRAATTVLATGGAGKVYLYTSNPDSATGDGIAMAWRAGLPIHNMEMVQFHPTVLYSPEAKTFLISEAVRGEGGVLINSHGERFVEKFDERGSLAPRDIVARAIDHEMKTRGDKHVFLDITHKPREFLEKRFPNIFATCLDNGIDMSKDPIPVVPAAHYCCGGVEAGVDGSTRLPGLMVVGEASCTGLHGANRLASNSLLEGLVCARLMSKRVAADGIWRTPVRQPIPDWQYGNAVASDEEVVVEHNWNEVRTCMWDYVGIVRTDKRLERALRRIVNLRKEIRDYYLRYLVTADMLELRNIAACAELIVRSAMQRRESRGLHFTLDYPGLLPKAADTVILDPPGDAKATIPAL